MNLALDLGHFSLKLSQDLGSLYRMDEDGHVEDLVHIDNRGKPTLGQISRVRNYEEASNDFLTQIDFLRGNLKSRRGDNVFQFQNSSLEDFLRQDRLDLLSLLLLA